MRDIKITSAWVVKRYLIEAKKEKSTRYAEEYFDGIAITILSHFLYKTENDYYAKALQKLGVDTLNELEYLEFVRLPILEFKDKINIDADKLVNDYIYLYEIDGDTIDKIRAYVKIHMQRFRNRKNKQWFSLVHKNT